VFKEDEMFPVRLLLFTLLSGLLLVVTAACSSAVAPPQPDAAMMAKETETAMMAKETDTAMMAKGTDTAMMAKETDTAMMAKETDTAMMGAEFPPERFDAHFVDSMPMHKGVLDALPAQVLLNFNFTLSDASTITIEKDGKELKSAPGMLGANKLSMKTEIPADAGAGLYLVKYKACWPDNSCHDGQFAFAVK
jgi:methionine-rich copper-binding protein CopC